MGTTQSKDYVLTPRFLSANEKDIEEIRKLADLRLEAQTIWVQTGITLLESEGMMDRVKQNINMLLKFLDGTMESISQGKLIKKIKLIKLKIDEEQMKFAIRTLQSDINTINNRIKQIQNNDISAEGRKLEIMPALDRCESILNNFEDSNYVLYLNPLISSPWLLTFAQLYLFIIMIVNQFIPSHVERANNEKERIKEVLKKYQNNTFNNRYKIIRIVETYEKWDRHFVDVVIDDFGYQSERMGEKYYWHRAFQQGPICNNSYKSAVRITYERFFEKFISLID